ncbi:hypothetical protein HQ520_07935, partial [bacterium]|nr:hypothetical protein [bacterium]
DKDKDKDSVEGGVGETNSRKPEPCLCDVAQEIAVEYLAQVTRPSPDSRGDRSVTSGKAQKNITELLSRRGYTADQLRLAIDRRAEEVEHDVATKGKAFGVQLAANFFNPDEPNFLALLEDEWRGPGEEEPEPVLSAEESAKADAAYLIWREKQEAMQA